MCVCEWWLQCAWKECQPQTSTRIQTSIANDHGSMQIIMKKARQNKTLNRMKLNWTLDLVFVVVVVVDFVHNVHHSFIHFFSSSFWSLSRSSSFHPFISWCLRMEMWQLFLLLLYGSVVCVCVCVYATWPFEWRFNRMQTIRYFFFSFFYFIPFNLTTFHFFFFWFFFVVEFLF